MEKRELNISILHPFTLLARLIIWGNNPGAKIPFLPPKLSSLKPTQKLSPEKAIITLVTEEHSVHLHNHGLSTLTNIIKNHQI